MSGLRLRVLTVSQFHERRVPGAPPVLLAADPNSNMPGGMLPCVLEQWTEGTEPNRFGHVVGDWEEVPVIQVEELPQCG